MKRVNQTPCMNCQDRKVGCHGSCEKYKELQAHYKKIREEKKYENEFYDYAVKTTMRNKFFSGERWF